MTGGLHRTRAASPTQGSALLPPLPAPPLSPHSSSGSSPCSALLGGLSLLPLSVLSRHVPPLWGVGAPRPHRLRGDQASVSGPGPGRLNIWISNVRAACLVSMCCSSRLRDFGSENPACRGNWGAFSCTPETFTESYEIQEDDFQMLFNIGEATFSQFEDVPRL